MQIKIFGWQTMNNFSNMIKLIFFPYLRTYTIFNQIQILKTDNCLNVYQKKISFFQWIYSIFLNFKMDADEELEK